MNMPRATSGHSYRGDARRAIERLGETADYLVRTGMWLHVGEWFGWADWLRNGTRIAGSGPLPGEITVADDLLIAANILENVGADDLVRRFVERSRPAIGPHSPLAQLNRPTLGELLTFTARAINAHNPHILGKFYKFGDRQHFIVRFNVPASRLSEMLGIIVLVMIYQIIQPLARGHLGAIVLESTLPRSALTDLVWSEFRCQVIPDSKIHRISIPEEMAAFRNPEFDPAMWSLAQGSIVAAERSGQNSAIVRRVRSRVADMLSTDGQAPRLKQVANDEGLSERTIIRLLGRESTSFHTIVEEERLQIATRLIIDPDIPLNAIAERLGFTDQSSFGRSFRKWFGMPPGEYRKALRRRGQI